MLETERRVVSCTRMIIGTFPGGRFNLPLGNLPCEFTTSGARSMGNLLDSVASLRLEPFGLLT
jgi:hypothetical protein